MVDPLYVPKQTGVAGLSECWGTGGAKGTITPILDIPEGCVLVGHQIARFFIFSDLLLNILLAMYLDSNKVASN